MSQCQVCRRAQPAALELASGELCECAIIQTPGILSGRWLIRGTRIFAVTLLHIWIDTGRDKSSAVALFRSRYVRRARRANSDALSPDRVHRALDWLSTHGGRVALEELRDDFEALKELDELSTIAHNCHRLGVDRGAFVAAGYQMIREVWDAAADYHASLSAEEV